MCGSLRAARRGRQSETQSDWKLRAEIGVDPAWKRLIPPDYPKPFDGGPGLMQAGAFLGVADARHCTRQGGTPIQSKKRSCAPNASWRLAGSDGGRSRPGHRGVCKDRWRASEGDSVAREFGHNDPAGTLSREHHKSEQGQRSDPRHAEGLGKRRAAESGRKKLELTDAHHELCSRQFSGPLSGHCLMTAAWPS